MSAAPFNLLLLEDNEGDARLVQLALAEHAPDEFVVTRVEQLADALVRIGRERFDVALCDLGLPDSTGLATAQAIAARAPALPLVVLTGSHDEDLGREAIQHGAQDYLVKNEATGSLLARTLRYAIERTRLQAGLRAANEALEHRVAERTAGLRESEQRYRGLFEASPEAAAVTVDHRVAALNPAALRLFGAHSVEQLAGRAILDFVHPDFRELAVSRIRSVLAEGRQTPFAAYRLMHLDGSEFDAEISSAPFSEAGRPAVLTLFRDITERKRAELALRESEARFRTLTEMSSDFYWETDAGHRLTQRGSADRKASAVSVFQRGAQIGQRRWEVPYLSPDEAGWQAHRALLGAHLPFRDFELSRLGADGTERHISISGDPVFDAAGVFLGYRGVGSDITERKRAEQALRASEARYRSVVDVSPNAMLVHQDLRIVFANRAAAELYGVATEAQLIGRALLEFFPVELRDTVRKRSANAVAGGRRLPMMEESVLRPDGSLVEIEATAIPFEHEGRPAVLSAQRDITERKRADSALRAAEEQFRGLVEQSIAGSYVIQDGKLAYVNPRFAEIFGYGSVDELIGRESLSLVAEEDRGAVLDARRRLEGGATGMSYGFTALRKDGSRTDVGVHGAAATHQGRPAVIGLIQDISEKKRAEEQIQRYIAQLEGAFMRTVEVATTLSEMRDPYTAGHERRVAEIAVAISAELGFDARRQEGLRVAGYLHDIGKITIPSEILSKPGKLSRVEFELIKGHAQASYDVLKGVEFPWPVAEVALQHHERLDGTGYPNGLKGDAILLEARILSVADVIEAMSSHRPYRPGFGIEKALAEIERGRGSAYDAAVADACLKLFREKNFVIPD